MPTQIEEIESVADALTLLREQIESEVQHAEASEKGVLEKLRAEVSAAAQAAASAHATLASQDLGARAKAQKYFDTLSERTTLLTETETGVGELETQLAAAFGISAANVTTLVDAISDLVAAEVTELDAARVEADAARVSWHTTRAELQNSRIALTRVEARLNGLEGEFALALKAANEARRLARTHLGREEASNARTAAVWTEVAKTLNAQMAAVFDPATRGLGVRAANVDEFISAWSPAWDGCVAAELAHQQATLTLERAALRESLAEVALAGKRAQLPYAFDSEIAALIAGF